MRLTNKNEKLRDKIVELLEYSINTGNKIEFNSKYATLLLKVVFYEYSEYSKEITIYNNGSNGGGYINLDLTKTHELIEDNEKNKIILKCKDYTLTIIKEQI